MTQLGFSHLGLATRDMAATLDFYQNVLGFRAVRCDVLKVAEGGEIQHVFFDAGRGQSRRRGSAPAPLRARRR